MRSVDNTRAFNQHDGVTLWVYVQWISVLFLRQDCSGIRCAKCAICLEISLGHTVEVPRFTCSNNSRTDLLSKSGDYTRRRMKLCFQSSSQRSRQQLKITQVESAGFHR